MKKCTKCNQLKRKTEFHRDCQKKDNLRPDCKSCVSKARKKYYESNKKAEHKRSNDYFKKKYHTDKLYRAKMNLRRRMAFAFKASYWTKTSMTKDMLGAEYEVVHKHIEDQFTEGMTWDNYGIKGWHIDHVIPLASAKTEEELIKLCHYTNLQPLWAEDNLKKGDKIL